MFSDTKFPQNVPDSNVPDTARNREGLLSICRCVCKRQQEYGTKTFRVRDGLSDLTRSELSLQHEICCRRYIWQCYECSTSALVNITVQSFLVALAQLVRISFFLKL